MDGFGGWRLVLAAGIVASLLGCVVATTPPGAIVVANPPPPVRVEVIPPAPAVAMVWIPGYWDWDGRWLWRGGYWARPPYSGAYWVPGYSWQRDGRWYWDRGHWGRH